MSVAVKSKIGHSYITSIKNICGGRAIIKGTRIPVLVNNKVVQNWYVDI